MCKECPKCKSSSVEFGPNKARKDGMQTYCRLCMATLRAEKQYDKARWENNREAESLRNKSYRAANAERLAPIHRAKANKRREENPAGKRASNIARKHGAALATPGWADKPAMNLIYAEAKRMQSADGVVRHVDHIVPLKHPLVCGLHVPANLQILTATENMSKHNSFEARL